MPILEQDRDQPLTGSHETLISHTHHFTSNVSNNLGKIRVQVNISSEWCGVVRMRVAGVRRATRRGAGATTTMRGVSTSYVIVARVLVARELRGAGERQLEEFA
ncbi:unnamed protein product [Chrysodeixis includens]|uniref:Uncharacterized protein n=1 Tax=Chrysodeixis includens TaxID=689277 RepID=A0A9N8L1P3_CHRIL|nr:unnamed protein product [Chrysodeixis includens]